MSTFKKIVYKVPFFVFLILAGLNLIILAIPVVLQCFFCFCIDFFDTERDENPPINSQPKRFPL